MPYSRNVVWLCCASQCRIIGISELLTLLFPLGLTSLTSTVVRFLSQGFPFTKMPSSIGINTVVPSLSTVQWSFQPSFPDPLSPTTGTYFRTTIQLHDNNMQLHFLGLTTHPLLNCNMPGKNWGASKRSNFVFSSTNHPTWLWRIGATNCCPR